MRLYKLEVSDHLSVNAADDSVSIGPHDSWIVLVEHLLSVHGNRPWNELGVRVHNVLDAGSVRVNGCVRKALQ